MGGTDQHQRDLQTHDGTHYNDSNIISSNACNNEGSMDTIYGLFLVSMATRLTSLTYRQICRIYQRFFVPWSGSCPTYV